MDPPIHDHDSCTQEKEEFLRTINLLINNLMETEDQLKEAINAKLEAEERVRRQTEAPRGSSEGRVFAAEEGRRLAEMDLRAKIEERNGFERMYHEQWSEKKAIQEELAVCMTELEDARIKIAELQTA